MKNKILNMKKIIIVILAFFTTSLVAQNTQDQQFWEDAEKGYIYNIGHYKNINLNVHNEDGKTPLMIAVKNGHSAVIDAFSEGIVDITMQDFEGKTAFDYIKTVSDHPKERMNTKIYGTLKVLEARQIVRGKAKIIQYSYKNDTNLLKITIKGMDCDQFLFPKNTECKALPKTKPDNHPIFKAIKSKDNTLFDTLLESVDMTIKNKSNYSLLWAGIFYKNLYVVDQVLQKGADINESDPNNLHIPISWAIIQNDAPLMQILLDNGVDVNSKDKFGNFVLSKAMYKCKSFETIALLLDNGANPYLKNKRGKTVFDTQPVFCKDKSQITIMRELLKTRSAFNP